MQIDVDMTPTIIDLPLYCQFEAYQLVWINGSYDDYLIRVGTDIWQTNSDSSHERFEKTGSYQTSFILSEMHVAQSDNMSHIDQDFFMSKTEQIPSDTEFSKFVSMKMRFANLPCTRLDIVFQIPNFSQ